MIGKVREIEQNVIQAPTSNTQAAEFRKQVYLLRSEFVDLHTTSYRLRMFRLIRDLRALTATAAESNLNLLLAEAQQGADGLEPLIIAYVDAVVRKGDDPVRARVTEALENATGRIRWRYSQPFAGTLVPLGRFDTAVIIDVRADAMRQIFDAMLRYPDVLSFEEWLDHGLVREKMCGLPVLGQMPTALDPPALDADQVRDDLCKSGGIQAGPGDMLDAIAMAGCLDVNLDAFKLNDEYTTVEMAADLEQCIEDMAAEDTSPSRPVGNGFALGTGGGMLGDFSVKIEADLGQAAAEGVKGLFDIIKGVGSFGGTSLRGHSTSTTKPRRRRGPRPVRPRRHASTPRLRQCVRWSPWSRPRRPPKRQQTPWLMPGLKRRRQKAIW
jgi:hypothetical protein